MIKNLKNKLKKMDQFSNKHFKKLMIVAFLSPIILGILREGITKVDIVILSLVAVYFLSNYIQKKLSL